ncbi:hypothetical protein PHYBLDRAFT_150305 [Phycomyces blakesleeanus NRRL 1555(-)]|uniref:Uncharacterized protein n=1 Tax=Phycomyces blakesleeanus (strain ATCC 8743b / DSM 1359 / FGSC 10004 / NBRC 33097 / NRRL 1555) TaxID=763407 RepID=A0A162THV8_PHYB8|nr:hypothetical protein PHYBLDRAFT_150305 [Phycomyces blakesleeanus NRRL 1555(-)]OAD68712.1 hypothetical protein PHYBLDRAFT_150305 [Phycomyces blakesleeanus NRRL 1555(-)]|eukprot:XP_018286752.1 hypothetical protein PHYBLDRAFT_150305 [Phycomyces blakesleeanus NRRL 1555(-)]
MNNGNNTTINDPSLQCMMDNTLAIYSSNQLVLAQNLDQRPTNTTKAYLAKQEEWRCLKKEFGDNELVNDQKLSSFMIDYVMNRGRKLKRDDNNSLIPLGKGSIAAYVKAVADICSKQKALGLNLNGVARGPLVRAFLDTANKASAQTVRKNFEDCGKNTLNNGYIKQELERISQYFMEKNDTRAC